MGSTNSPRKEIVSVRRDSSPNIKKSEVIRTYFQLMSSLSYDEKKRLDPLLSEKIGDTLDTSTKFFVSNFLLQKWEGDGPLQKEHDHSLLYTNEIEEVSRPLLKLELHPRKRSRLQLVSSVGIKTFSRNCSVKKIILSLF